MRAQPTPKSVVILGLARQGKALARFFAERGAHVVVSDLREATQLSGQLDELADLPVKYVLGQHPVSLLDGCELLCLSGGVSPEIPLVQEALRRGIPLSNDAQEFMTRCPAPVVGITGSAGKTTTTALVGRMLEASGFRTWVGGNIGYPLLNALSDIQETDRVVVELSSFQLELMDVSPPVAGLLNITPNHLDRHHTMEAYIAAKRHIMDYQGPQDVLVLGYDNERTRALAGYAVGQVRFFSGLTHVEEGTYLHGGELVLRHQGHETVVARRDAIRLRGFHNVQNVLAAIALADAAGATVEGMRQAIAAFTGVSHRLEEVCRRRGVLWIDDSIATTPERVVAALASFEEPLVLLAGGRDKDLPWGLFAERVVERVRVLILFGEAAPLIEEHVREAWERAEAVGKRIAMERLLRAGDLRNAVTLASELARPGDVVLLSPGGTSFDAFQDFAERGDCFKRWVAALED